MNQKKMELDAQPIGGELFTRGYKILLALGAMGLALIVWRFFFVGLGGSTALSDGYPFGLWIAFDVVTGTALACGGYAVALVVYIFNRGQYHPLIRPAILTSALGYTIAGLSVAVDLGRPWNMWKIPLYFWDWNLNSALLEVALCIMAYVAVLWIELSPAFLARFKDDGPTVVQRFARRAIPILDRSLIWIVALGMLLPTMHQSSLGAMMLLAGPRLHPLWNTPFLPLLFLLTSLAMGYAMVVFETVFSSNAFGRKADAAMLVKLQKVAVSIGIVFVLIRFFDLAYRGRLGMTAKLDLFGIIFWLEMGLFLLPALIMLASRTPNLGNLFLGAMSMAVAGGLYRFDTFLVAFQPGPGWHYFPSIPEILISVGLVAIGIAVYVAIVRKFPIIGGRPSQAH
ncbi:MAG: NrfD/PsrC family molybdoenzyme membrane anchor subunit [Acidobacteriota bacterium]